MFNFSNKQLNYKTWFEHGTAHVPIQVKFERRNDARASVGRSGLIVRMPNGISANEHERLIISYIEWAKNWLISKPDLLAFFTRKDYNSIRTLQVGQYSYQVEIQELAETTAHSARRKDQTITIQLMSQSSELAKNKAVKTLLSRLVAQHQKPWVVKRVLELNERHFNKPIRNVFLKYNQSNWGSCSTGSNINFSTRLLFAPSEVIDYVIIHELAHLVEQNHSDRFWAQVARAMPDYERHEDWLKHNGKTCDF
jgi:predicted metal-dependent hydrolase